jgi:CheY-like chemotaxis protein
MAELDMHHSALHPGVNPGAYVLIEVADSGTGIAPEIVDNIFEPFFTTKEPGQGTGLGLSMVFGFVRQSGGHLEVDSEMGLGTTFRIYLPLAPADQTEVVIMAAQIPVIGGHETILLIEDSPPLRHAAARQLADLGYQVREAAHADGAIAILSSDDPVDLMFTDVVMPGEIDGFGLADHARKLRRNLKVLLTLGFSQLRSVTPRTTGGPFRLLNKPYSYDDLARALRKALDTDDEQAHPG